MHVTDQQELPLLKSARREAIAAFVIWGAVTCYSLGYCVFYGYGRDPETLTYVLGFPDWVFWGIVAPWGVCTIGATVFALFFMTDEELPESGNT